MPKHNPPESPGSSQSSPIRKSVQMKKTRRSSSKQPNVPQSLGRQGTFDEELPCSWTSRINIVKWLLLPKLILTVTAILSTIPKALFTELEKQSKIHEETRRPQIAKAILGRKHTVKYISLLQLHYEAKVTNTVWNWHKKTYRSTEYNIEPGNKFTQL